MHRNFIFHRDIKPENIFIGNKNKLKIGSYDISVILDPNNQRV